MKVIFIIIGIIFFLVFGILVFSFGFYCGQRTFKKVLMENMKDKYKESKIVNSLIKAVVNNDETAIVTGGKN